MQVTSEASLSRTGVTLCARGAGVEVVVDSPCSVAVSGSLHVPLLHLLTDSGALQVIPRPLHVRDCFALCTALRLYFINSLSELCATLALLRNKCTGKRTRQNGSRKPELGIIMLSTLS